jgi:hypothetical protein
MKTCGMIWNESNEHEILKNTQNPKTQKFNICSIYIYENISKYIRNNIHPKWWPWFLLSHLQLTPNQLIILENNEKKSWKVP